MNTKRALQKAFPTDLVVELTGKLVAIPSRNPPGEEKVCANAIWKTLREWGVDAELVREPDPERPQVVAWVGSSGQGPTFVLNGHIDTVREGDLAAWDTPPFEPTRIGDRLYGLGACDIKGSLAVGMAILKTLHEQADPLPGMVMFHAAMGEEMAEDGTRTLLNMGYTGDCAVVMEPTNLTIGRATRGVGWYRLILTGNPQHCGSVRPEDPDVVSQFGHVVEALSTYNACISHNSHPLLPSPGCRLTQARVGERHNHLPERGEFIIDRRMLPRESFDQVSAELHEILDGIGQGDSDFNYELEYLYGNEPVEISGESPLIDVLQRNLRAVDGQEAQITGMIAGTDVRNFVHDQGIPAVNFGAGDFGVCHKPNEFVPIDDLVRRGRILLGTALDILYAEEVFASYW